MTMLDAEPLLYCLNANLPHPVIAALLALSDDTDLLHETWLVWSREEYGLSDRRAFAEAVENVTDYTIVTCGDCAEWVWESDTTTVEGGGKVCDHPCLYNYTACYECSTHAHDDTLTYADGRAYCSGCRDNYLTWCEDCETYSRHEHQHGCECEAPHQEFEFPANGSGTIGNDERLDVTLPAGTIDKAGRRAIERVLLDQGISWDRIDKALDAVGDQWQAKRGNFTRRLSRELYANHSVKVAPGVLTLIGNLARQHSSETSEWSIEFTRNLNLGADDFCHSESCWWQSYYESRCALKNWGGLGLRAFDEWENPVGRAWVQPLDADLQPTHSTVNAHAYVVFNCYGVLDEYKAARIVAHLTSRTYRKVGLLSTPQYINGNTGFLVADEATCASTEQVSFAADAHDTHDASTIDQEEAA